MKRINYVALIVLGTCPLPGIAAAAQYAVDVDHTSIIFKIRHLGISTVSGNFERFAGSFEFDPDQVEQARFNAKVEAASINTGVEKRDGHLRSGDFFDAEKHPHITFASKKVEAGKGKEGKQLRIHGDLTIRGVTKSVVLDGEVGGIANDPWGNTRMAISASGQINRKDYGLNWNQVLETGGLLVGEDVTIVIEVEGIEKK